MTDPVGLVAAVSQRLVSVLADRTREMAPHGPEALVLAEAAGRAIEGGKRLRARFCATGWAGIRAEHDDAVIDACAALEVFQAAALVHDDLVDNSDTRRGRPSAHRALEAEHRARAWAGNAEEFGRSAAILLGDLLVAWSDDLIERALLGVDDAAARVARREYAVMRTDVTVGQFLDVAHESAWIHQPESEHADRALAIASLKSGRYSVVQPLVIGAALAGGDDAQRAALAAFGLPIGLAFQLRDDLLGVFGDEAQTGKPAGDDLREGKRTLLVAYAREAMTASEREGFDRALGDRTLTPTEVAALQDAIAATNARDRIEDHIAQYTAQAEAALADAPLRGEALASLRELAVAATRRVA